MIKKTLKVNIKYGFDGLKAKVYSIETGTVIGEINISKDNAKIFEFLGYDYNRFLQGFNNKQEIFDYIIESKYFDAGMFQMENLNAIDRKRNRKRATYQEFLQFINDNKFEQNYTFKKRKDYYYSDIDSFFPEAKFLLTLKEFRKKEKERKLIASKFNGHLLMEWTGLQGKELGQALSNFRKQFTDFNEYCLKTSPEKIKEDFMNFYSK